VTLIASAMEMEVDRVELTDRAQSLPVEYPALSSPNFGDVQLPQLPQYPVHMDGRKAGRVADVRLCQGELKAATISRADDPKSRAEFGKKMGDPAKRLLARIGQRPLGQNRSIDGAIPPKSFPEVRKAPGRVHDGAVRHSINLRVPEAL
jgi:hypothetical protein